MLVRARWGSRAGSRSIAAKVLALSALLATVASVAGAAPTTASPGKTAKGAKAVAAPAHLSPDLVKKLASGNEDDMKSALDDVRLLGTAGAAAAPEIVAILDHGAHRELTVAALETLGDLHVASTGPSIVPYVGHRELGIRRAAVTALGETHGEGSLPVLRRALGDPSDDVRSAAARGLATKDAAPYAMDLALAIDHKILGAGYALGAACDASTCGELPSRLGKADNADISAGLDALFERSDLSSSVKMDILAKLASSNDPAAHEYLIALRAKQPKGGAKKPGANAKDDAAFAKALAAAVTGVAK